MAHARRSSFTNKSFYPVAAETGKDDSTCRQL